MRTYLVVIAGQLLSNLGSHLTDFGLSLWIFQHTGSATQWGIAILTSALPRILLAPVAGALVDRWDRRKVMLVCDTVLAVKTLAVLLLLVFGGLTTARIYLLNILGSAFGKLHGLAWSASTVLLVPKKHLARVNGLTRAAGEGAGLLVPALAGVLFVIVGLKGIAAVDLASWAFAVVPLLFVHIPRPARVEKSGEKTRLIQEIAGGWKVLRSMKGLLYLLFAYSAVNLFGITTEVLRGPYLLTLTGPQEFGFAESAASLGALLGGLLLGAVGNPRRAIRVILVSELLISLLGIAQGAFPVYAILVPVILLSGVAVSFCDGTIQTLWQRKVRPDYQGRVFALKDTLNLSLAPLGVMVFSPLAEFVLEPRLAVGGVWSESVGRIIGIGAGRGMGLLFIASGIVCVLVVALAAANRHVRRAESEIPDATP